MTAGLYAAAIERIHEHVRGVDGATGRRYVAGDPALLLWCTLALVQSSLAVGRAFGAPLSAQDSDRYVAEMTVAAELAGVFRPLVPASVADLGRYVASVRPELRCTPAAAESMAYLSLSVLDAMVLGESGVLEARSGSPWRCGQRGLHEGPGARRRGSLQNPDAGPPLLTNLVASRAQAGRPVIARDGPAQRATRECSAVY